MYSAVTEHCRVLTEEPLQNRYRTLNESLPTIESNVTRRSLSRARAGGEWRVPRGGGVGRVNDAERDQIVLFCSAPRDAIRKSGATQSAELTLFQWTLRRGRRSKEEWTLRLGRRSKEEWTLSLNVH